MHMIYVQFYYTYCFVVSNYTLHIVATNILFIIFLFVCFHPTFDREFSSCSVISFAIIIISTNFCFCFHYHLGWSNTGKGW